MTIMHAFTLRHIRPRLKQHRMYFLMFELRGIYIICHSIKYWFQVPEKSLIAYSIFRGATTQQFHGFEN